MLVSSLIFRLSISFLFFCSGFLKIFSLKDSTKSIIELNIMPVRLAKIIGILAPFIEIITAILLIIASDKFIINILAIIVIIFLIAINFKAIIENRQTDCFCFGKLIPTKLGYGGLVQCFLLLLSIIPSIIFSSSNLDMLLNLSFLDITFILITSILWSISLILIRKIVEIVYSLGASQKV